MDFKKRIEKSTQVEKCLIFQKTIQGIKFSKEFMELIVFIKDTTDLEIDNFLRGGVGKTAARIRGEHPNPCAPHCTYDSILKIGDPNGIRTRVTTVKG